MQVLETPRLRLRPISDSDNETLCQWRNSHEYITMVSSKRMILSLEKFVAEQKKAFETDRHQQFIIENRKGESVGTVYTFGLNLVDGHVFINTFIADRFRNRGYGPEASIIVTCYMFDFYPIFKVYFEAFEYNEASLSMMRTAGLVQEGVFRGHRYFDGKHHDVIRFAAYRDSLQKLRALEKRFKEGRQRSIVLEAE